MKKTNLNLDNSYYLEHLNDMITLKLINVSRSKTALLFCASTAIFIFSLPIIIAILLQIPLTFGLLISFIISWLVAGYMGKLFLWNKSGEEVFIISKNKLEQYNDYRYYKNNHLIHTFKIFELVLYIDGKVIQVNEKVSSIISTDNFQPIRFKLDDKIIFSHRKISLRDIIEINKEFRKYSII